MFRSPKTEWDVSKDLSKRIIDPWTVAQQQQHLSGEIALSSLPRLLTQLEQPQGQVCIDWQFQIITHRAVIVGHIDVQLILQCQRCLQPLSWSTRLNTALCPLKPGQTEQNLPAGFESISLSAERILLSDLVEDEVLLAVPFAPFHEQCPAHDYAADNRVEDNDVSTMEAQHHPFQALAALKQHTNDKKPS